MTAVLPENGEMRINWSIFKHSVAPAAPTIENRVAKNELLLFNLLHFVS